MNRLREHTGLEPLAKARLAAAYALAGQPKIAAGMLDEKLSFKPRDGVDPTFGSEARDRAMVLEATSLVGRKDEAKRHFEELRKLADGDGYLNTHAAAYALIAMARYVESLEEGIASFRVTVDGKSEDVSLAKPIYQRDLAVRRDVLAPLSIANEGGGELHVRVILRGHPDIGKTESFSNGLAVSASYDSGSAEVEQGQDLVAEITVRNTTSSPIHQLALVHLVPGGWEIRNDRFEGRRDPTHQYEYRDIRDDRILTYFGLNHGESKTFTVRLHGAYVGRFYQPPIRVESMYDGTIAAETDGDWVEVRRPGGGG
jgi:uncharacterized protein YfaS (alpha-2-macroglobulin family)